ncbi:MAG: CHASE3 domain-containing protein, partial [Devosiaceae bacterium]
MPATKLLKNVNFRAKLALAFSCVLVVLFGVSATLYHKLNQAEERVGWTNHTFEVLDAIDGALLGMVNQETATRGFLLAADENFLGTYDVGVAMFDENMQRLRDLTSDNPRAQQLVTDIVAAGMAWRQNHAQTAINLVRDPLTRVEGQQMEIQGQGKSQMDAVRGQLAEFTDMESGLLVERSDSMLQIFASGKTLIILATAMGSVLALAAAFALVQLVDKPLRRATQTIDSIRGENFAVEITDDD